MSKTDAMRALREARRAATPATATPAPPAARVAARAAAPPVRPAADLVAEPVGGSDAGLCGHRNMGGRSCTRPVDHVRDGTKNHRYG